ncbi:mitochondrial fission 1 protein isoform X1 [Toxorhynchites rutilus septentrionalis]|uniref:mitochondrial fission 1 protein isoform X1 n=1 Tax=Toxorhynchites rutilus septentrionalis TaxID=329112 RepID=UPI00247A2B64|nr:mitochondrial fission 1 protein isoform X1 [Toxorhynchites rutilus septentrionalis]XP_055639944.1 mitochondrial fission 1 protein isoform X1 [Toxorhynchites rutilus septentrionalis]
MEEVLNDIVSQEELAKFEKKYNQELNNKSLSHTTQFEYAWCLIRSNYTNDIKSGVRLLEDLCVKNSDGKRDYIYYLAIAYTRLKEYSTAMKYVQAFLEIEPSNQQVIGLEEYIKKKMDIEGLKGVAMASGAALILGGILGIGFALAKK